MARPKHPKRGPPKATGQKKGKAQPKRGPSNKRTKISCKEEFCAHEVVPTPVTELPAHNAFLTLGCAKLEAFSHLPSFEGHLIVRRNRELEKLPDSLYTPFLTLRYVQHKRSNKQSAKALTPQTINTTDPGLLNDKTGLAVPFSLEFGGNTATRFRTRQATLVEVSTPALTPDEALYTSGSTPILPVTPAEEAGLTSTLDSNLKPDLYSPWGYSYEEMAPVRDPTSVQASMKEAIQILFDMQSDVHGFVPETQPLLIEKVSDLANSLSRIQKLTSKEESPNNPIHDVRIAPEFIDYVDDGRNPDIYTRDFVELVQRGNSVLNGKQKAFRDFSHVFADALKEGIDGIGGEVDQVMRSVESEEQGNAASSSQHQNGNSKS